MVRVLSAQNKTESVRGFIAGKRTQINSMPGVDGGVEKNERLKRKLRRKPGRVCKET